MAPLLVLESPFLKGPFRTQKVWLTFPLAVLLHVQLLVALLALQMFLSREQRSLKVNQKWTGSVRAGLTISSSRVSSFSFFWSSKSLSCLLWNYKDMKTTWRTIRTGTEPPAGLDRSVCDELLTGSVRSSLSSSNTV